MDVEVAVHQPTLNNATRHDPSENLDLGLLQIMRAGYYYSLYTHSSIPAMGSVSLVGWLVGSFPRRRGGHDHAHACFVFGWIGSRAPLCACDCSHPTIPMRILLASATGHTASDGLYE